MSEQSKAIASALVTPWPPTPPKVTDAEWRDYVGRYPAMQVEHTEADAMACVLAILIEHGLEQKRERVERACGGGPGALNESLQWLERYRKHFTTAWTFELSESRLIDRRESLLAAGWTPLHVAKWELVNP